MSQDPFLTATQCQRCGGSLKDGRTISMYNKQIICKACKDQEILEPDYAEAVAADHREILKGNREFEGIGWKHERK